ncbi:unnamed protein product [Mucor fragilis]
MNIIFLSFIHINIMGRKSHASHHKEVTEKEDKHRPKTKAEKKLEQQQHKLKKQAKAAEAKKGFE